MSDTGVEIVGLDRLVSTLGSAGDRLDDCSEPDRQTAALLSNAGRTRAPRRSGRLASSVTGRGDRREATVTSGLAYANRTHWGYRKYSQAPQRFLTDPAEQLRSTWEGFYLDHVNRQLATVKGA